MSNNHGYNNNVNPHQPPQFASPVSRCRDANEIRRLFGSYDALRRNAITCEQLAALFCQLVPHRLDIATTILLMKTFKCDPAGYVDCATVEGMASYVGQWLEHFVAFDRDASGAISASELCQALRYYRINISPDLGNKLAMLFGKLPPPRAGPPAATSAPPGQYQQYPGFQQHAGYAPPEVTFDAFIRCCILLEKATTKFAEIDKQKVGYATLSFEQFISLLLECIV